MEDEIWQYEIDKLMDYSIRWEGAVAQIALRMARTERKFLGDCLPIARQQLLTAVETKEAMQRAYYNAVHT